MQLELPPIVEKLRSCLSTPIEQDIDELRSLRVELAEAVVDARQLLLEKRRQMLWPKDKELTELDRKTRLDGDVAMYERNYEFLYRLEEIAKEKLELYKTVSSG